MKPKEKAEEIVRMMKNCLYSDGMYDAKQCAFVAVDQILDSLDKSLIHSDIQFWQQVKSELEKL